MMEALAAAKDKSKGDLQSRASVYFQNFMDRLAFKGHVVDDEGKNRFLVPGVPMDTFCLVTEVFEVVLGECANLAAVSGPEDVDPLVLLLSLIHH